MVSSSLNGLTLDAERRHRHGPASTDVVDLADSTSAPSSGPYRARHVQAVGQPAQSVKDDMGHLKIAVIAVTLMVVGSARADQLIRKAGEWRSTVTGVGPQPQTMDMCFAQSTLEQAMAKMAASGNCPKRDIRQNGPVVTLDVVCGMMSMKGTATMVGDTAYTADLTMTMNMHGKATTFHSITTSKWIGACKPGQTPRD
jgi:hypothetical protein